MDEKKKLVIIFNSTESQCIYTNAALMKMLAIFFSLAIIVVVIIIRLPCFWCWSWYYFFFSCYSFSRNDRFCSQRRNFIFRLKNMYTKNTMWYIINGQMRLIVHIIHHWRHSHMWSRRKKKIKEIILHLRIVCVWVSVSFRIDCYDFIFCEWNRKMPEQTKYTNERNE